MRYSISVLIRPAQDAEQGDVSNEQWYQGEADVPPGSVPSLRFPNEGDIALFAMDPVAAGRYDGDAVAEDVQSITQAIAGDDAPTAAHETGVVEAAHELTDAVPVPPGDADPEAAPAAIAEASAEAGKAAKKGK